MYARTTRCHRRVFGIPYSTRRNEVSNNYAYIVGLFLVLLGSVYPSDALQLGLPSWNKMLHQRSCLMQVQGDEWWSAKAAGCSLAHKKPTTIRPPTSSVRPMTAAPSGDEKQPPIDDKTPIKWTKPTLAIAVPALIGMIADPLLSLVDTLYVSQLGSIELAALGACTSIFHLAFNAFRATTAATTSLVAGALQQGSNNNTSTIDAVVPNENAQYVLSTTLQFSTLLGIFVALQLITTSNFALSCMGVPRTSTLYPHAISYLRIRALAAPAVLFITVSEGAFRGYGDTRIPLLASISAAVINAIFDPILMFHPFHMGVGGAAAATAGSQIVAMLVYSSILHKRNMISSRSSGASTSTKRSPNQRRNVIYTILRANISMLIKQFSLLIAWAYATSRATQIGHFHVAAHQIALSLWLVFALLQDGLAVAAQVLMSRATSLKTVRSLTRFMVQASVVQSAACSLCIYILRGLAPAVFSRDVQVTEQLQLLMPVLTAFQPLVSATLVLESLVVGGKCFSLLAVGTCVATVISMAIMRGATSVVDIWRYGLTSLFVIRLMTAIIGVGYLNGLRWKGISSWWSKKRRCRNGTAASNSNAPSKINE